MRVSPASGPNWDHPSGRGWGYQSTHLQLSPFAFNPTMIGDFSAVSPVDVMRHRFEPNGMSCNRSTQPLLIILAIVPGPAG